MSDHLEPGPLAAGQKTPGPISRRRFGQRIASQLGRSLIAGRVLVRALVVLGGTLLIGWLWIILRFLWPPSKIGPQKWVRIAPLEEISTETVDTRWATQFGVWIVRKRVAGREQFFAFSTACTHLGCRTQWDPALRQFVCPCHGSAFSELGERLRGPATRPLDRCPLRLSHDGWVEVQPTLARRVPEADTSATLG